MKLQHCLKFELIRACITSRWYSTDSLRTSATNATPGGSYSRPVSPRNAGRKPQKSGKGSANCDSATAGASASASTSAAPKTRSVGVGTKRAESVHDLRKIEQPLPAMKVRVPRDTRTDLRPKKQLFVTRLEPPADEAEGSRDRGSNSGSWSAKSFIRKKLFRKSSEASNQDSSASSTKKRECYVLEELSCIEVVPVEDNRFERVSL